jgi:predicted AlkP superfamily pyrophosphatase or phosphodiesterase
MTVTTARTGPAGFGLDLIGAALIGLALSLAAAPALSQQTEPRAHHEVPRLAVGIVVDQMRHDMLYRYWDKFGEGGFRRLLGQGFVFENARFDYMPTYTGPGHASVYTGTTPAVHGIMGNDWYVRELGRNTYVTDDDEARTIGSDTDAGHMSPRWMLTTTVGDELWLHTNERARVVAISLKDRDAILPGGHTGQAYWFDYDTGDFITSSYYRDALPEWLSAFNARRLPDSYLANPWRTLLPLEQYVESLPDDSPYEAALAGQARPVFPHDLPTLAVESGPGLVADTPFGDELLLELALAAIEGESLGRGVVTDLLAISFSSPDHIGHRFGPMSVEVQDTYLRLDRQIARLLAHLDDAVGPGEFVLFLTSDHGVAHVPAYLADRSIPTGQISGRRTEIALRARLRELYGEDFIVASQNQQIFFDRARVREAGIDLRVLQETAAMELLEIDGIAGALSAYALQFGEFREGHRAKVQRGFNPRRSGDVVYWTEPQWTPFFGAGTRTTHGSGFSYDTRAPLIWYGWDIPAGRSADPVYISDIASTLAVILNTPFPSANTGTPMNELMRRGTR